MSDVFKVMLSTILHFTLNTSPMLISQDISPTGTISAPEPETKVISPPEDPSEIAALPKLTPAPSITIESSGDQSGFDLAWKLLGLRLENLSEPEIAELRRKEHQLNASRRIRYGGGLRVAQVNQLSAAAATVRKGDILLGLDGYETLGDVNLRYILQTSRIGDKSRMKFHIIQSDNTFFSGQLPLQHPDTTNEGLIDSSNQAAAIKIQIAQLEAELAVLKTKYGDNHTLVVRLRNRIATLHDTVKSDPEQELVAADMLAQRLTSADKKQLRIFSLNNSNATDAAKIIEQLFGSPLVTIAIDERTNALIIRADEARLAEIEAVVQRLDEQPNAIITQPATPTNDVVDHSSPAHAAPKIADNESVTPIAEYRRRLNELELPLLQLAEKVRSNEASLGKDHPGSVKQRADLRALVQQTFAARQKIQRAELAEFTRRLQRMQQLVDTRDRIAEQIVERRIEELLDTRPERETAVKGSGKSRMLNAQDAADESTKGTQRFKRTSVTANVTRVGSSSRFFDDQPVLYGFPLDKTNRAILVLRAKLSEDDLKSIDVDLGDFVFPAKVIASNPAAKLLLVQVSADISFDSVPLAMEHIQTYQRVQIGGHSSFVEELVVADVKPDQNTGIGQQIVTDAAFGISDTSLILNHDGTQLLGLGIGDNTIIPAPEISKWLNATMSKIGVQPTSD